MAKIDTNKNKINNILNIGVEEIFVKSHLEKALKEGKRLRIKFGIDPTGPKIHVGRAATLWKLREFQDLGHQIVLIIGDFTALIGDSSDKNALRRPLSKEDIKANLKDYKKQLGLILDMEKTEVRHNSEWLSKLRPEELVKLAMDFTVQQMINRRNFKERFQHNKEIGLHEFLYPIFQGYDSVAVKADIELGGSDQLFNLMAGRKIQEFYKQKPQDIMTTKMLYGLDGRKMSTSWGNVITITDAPENQYALIMSLRDNLIADYLPLVGRFSIEESNEIIKKMRKGALSPLEAKKMLAKKVVSIYHSDKEAEKAAMEFEKTFSKKEMPENIKAFHIEEPLPLIDLLVKTELAPSKSEARRLVNQGAVKIWKNDSWEKLTDLQENISASTEKILKSGKRKFAKIIK